MWRGSCPPRHSCLTDVGICDGTFDSSIRLYSRLPDPIGVTFGQFGGLYLPTLLKRLKKLSTEVAHANPWWEYLHDRYVRPDDTEGEYFYVHTHGSVVVIPELENGKLFMTRQFRYLNQRESLEFIGGGVKPHASSLESAREELLEEGGFTSEELTWLGRFNPFNGATDEICEVYVARKLTKVGAKPEASEEFEEHELTIEEIDQLILDGELWDGMSIAAFMLYKLKVLAR